MTRNSNDVRVKDVMSRDVVTAYPDDSLRVALQLLVENRVSALPIVDSKQRCIGMLSTTDLVDLECDHENDLDQLNAADPYTRQWLQRKIDAGLAAQQIKEVMCEHVNSVSGEASIVEATREMLRNRVHRLPVTDAKGRLIGIVSTMDILNAFVDGVAVA